MKVIFNFPEDMAEINKKINEFMADKIIRECTSQEVEAIIKYLKEQEKRNK